MNSVETACLVALCLFAIVSTGNGFPQESADQGQPHANTLFDELSEQPHQAAAENHRHKRATCDLLSGFGVNDSACATHCILRGNRGGYCNSKKVCACRN